MNILWIAEKSIAVFFIFGKKNPFFSGQSENSWYIHVMFKCVL